MYVQTFQNALNCIWGGLTSSIFRGSRLQTPQVFTASFLRCSYSSNTLNWTFTRATTIYFFCVRRRGRRVVALVARATTFLFWNKKFILDKKILTLFDNSFKKGLLKGRLTNEIIKRAILDAEISDNRNGPQVGHEQALYPRLHDRPIFDFLCFLSS